MDLAMISNGTHGEHAHVVGVLGQVDRNLLISLAHPVVAAVDELDEFFVGVRGRQRSVSN